jgi:hypothetical protein
MIARNAASASAARERVASSMASMSANFGSDQCIQRTFYRNWFRGDMI